MNNRVLSLIVCIASTVACANTPTASGTANTGTDSETSDTATVCGPDAETGVQVGMCAPEFSLPDRNDVSFSLFSQRGKVALVDISAIW